METPIVEKKSSGTWSIVGVGLVLLGALTLLGQFVPGVSQFLWGAAFAGSGGFLYHQYRKDTSRWWTLIPAYGLVSLGGLLYVDLLTNALTMLIPSSDLFIPAYIMAAMAFPFGWLYRERKLPLPIALIGVPFALMSAGFLLGAIGPIIPVILMLLGLFLILRQPNLKMPNVQAAPAQPKEIAPSRIEPIFEPLAVPTPEPAFTPIGTPQSAKKAASGPAADR